MQQFISLDRPSSQPITTPRGTRAYEDLRAAEEKRSNTFLTARGYKPTHVPPVPFSANEIERVQDVARRVGWHWQVAWWIPFGLHWTGCLEHVTGPYRDERDPASIHSAVNSRRPIDRRTAQELDENERDPEGGWVLWIPFAMPYNRIHGMFHACSASSHMADATKEFAEDARVAHVRVHVPSLVETAWLTHSFTSSIAPRELYQNLNANVQTESDFCHVASDRRRRWFRAQQMDCLWDATWGFSFGATWINREPMRRDDSNLLVGRVAVFPLIVPA